MYKLLQLFGACMAMNMKESVNQTEKERCDTLINRVTEKCFSICELKALVGSLRKS